MLELKKRKITSKQTKDKGFVIAMSFQCSAFCRNSWKGIGTVVSDSLLLYEKLEEVSFASKMPKPFKIGENGNQCCRLGLWGKLQVKTQAARPNLKQSAADPVNKADRQSKLVPSQVLRRRCFQQFSQNRLAISTGSVAAHTVLTQHIPKNR